MRQRLSANRNRNTGTSYSKPNASNTLPGEPTMPPLPAVT
jgi:hypothetical protein